MARDGQFHAVYRRFPVVVEQKQARFARHPLGLAENVARRFPAGQGETGHFVFPQRRRERFFLKGNPDGLGPFRPAGRQSTALGASPQTMSRPPPAANSRSMRSVVPRTVSRPHTRTAS